MKIHLFPSVLAVAATLAVVFSCSRPIKALSPENLNPEVTPEAPATINATISDLLAKVSFDPAYDTEHKPESMALTWATGDAIRVYNHADRTQYSDFAVDPSCIGQKAGVFTGTPISASSYDLEIINGAFDYANQTQPSDGVTTGLKYLASASGIADYSTVEFSSFSSVLALTVQMPSSAVAAVIKSVDITASENIFDGGNTLTITLDSVGDADDDGILHLFATLPQGNTAVPAGTTLLVHFNAPGAAHDVYTRFLELPASTFTANKVNNIKFSAYHSDKYAGTPDDGSSAHPYLIGDKYQVAAINGLATGGQTTYFKMIDDVDMTGATHNPINTNSGYTQVVNFDGNNKTISNLKTHFFYVFKGSIKDLTLDKSDVTSRGIFAEYCQGEGHTITNVNITDGTVNSGSSNVGGMIGRINNGSGTCLTITDCTVSGTNVTGTGVVGGVVGFAEALVSISGSKYTGGTVTSSGRYVGGFLGSTKDEASVITNCQVEDATINANYTDDARGGGFVGQLQTSCRVEGCTVGTSSAKVTVNSKQPKRTGAGTSADPYVYSKINVGGFVGVNYGTITQNGGVRSKAYAKLTTDNTYGTALNLGGFVGFGRGTIEYCDAVVDMTSLQGQYIGGFAGYVIQAGTKIDNCTVEGTVTGNNYTGGFAGYVDSGAPVISNCTASGSVTAQSGCGGFVGQTMTGVYTDCSTSVTGSFSGSNNGGFAGQIHGGSMTGCSASGSVTATGGGTYGGFAGLITNNGVTLTKCSATGNVTDEKGSYNGGFIGSINNGTVTISKCFASGDVTTDKTYASPFIGIINQGSNTINATIENCYATGNIVKSNQVRGGLIGSATAAATLSISNCYASGAIVGSFRLGGLIGNVQTASANISKCAAWNSEVTASSHGQTNWSSGAVIGTAHPNCHASDNYRKPGMSLTVYCPPPSADWNHPDIDGTTHPLWQNSQTAPFTWAESTFTAISAGSGNVDAGRWAYHGKVEAGKTLSQLASTTLGWDSSVWDFTGDLPTLR